MKKMMFTVLSAGMLATMLLGAAACGDDDAPAATPKSTTTAAAAATTDPAAVKAGTLTITGVSARTTTNDVSAMYLTITNSGPADRLLSVKTSNSPRVELHETVTQGASSVMQMRPSIEVPANGKVELKPGGYHVMLMGLSAPLTEGMTVTAELTFEKAGVVTLEAPVKSYAAAAQGGMTMPAGGTMPAGTMPSGSR